MAIYNGLIALSATLGTISAYLGVYAGIVSSALFVGSLLSGVLGGMSTYALQAQNVVANMANSWGGVYNELKNGANIPQVIFSLANFADRLIGFISNPIDKIINWLVSVFPLSRTILSDPIGFIMNIIRNNAGLATWLFSNPIAFILDMVRDYLGIVMVFKQDPISFIRDIISKIFPFLEIILSDPIGFIVQKLTARYPFLIAFFQDPLSYIVETFITTLEGLLDKYSARLIKMFEIILSKIF